MSTAVIHAVRERMSGGSPRVTHALRGLAATALGKSPQHGSRIETIVNIDEDNAADTPRTGTSASGG